MVPITKATTGQDCYQYTPSFEDNNVYSIYEKSQLGSGLQDTALSGVMISTYCMTGWGVAGKEASEGIEIRGASHTGRYNRHLTSCL